MKITTFSLFGLISVLALVALVGGSADAEQPDAPRPVRMQSADDSATDIGSAFTYQGRLFEGGSPADGVYDFVFKLFDAPTAGVQLMTEVVKGDVTVSDGLFTVELDFGNVFFGDAFWLQVEVRPGDESGDYIALAPRQPLTPAPYAMGLMPGAKVSGAVDQQDNGNGVLEVANTGTGDGILVDAPEGSGLFVESAFRGVRVESALITGLSVEDAGYYGVFVSSAGQIGVYARTLNHQGYGGSFLNAASTGQGAGLYARGNNGEAADIVLGANGEGTAADDGRIVSAPNYADSDIRFFTNDNLWIDLDEGGTNDASNFRILNSDDQTVFSVDESGNVATSGSAASVVDTGAFGEVQLYAVQSAENWFEDFGTAALLEGAATVTIDPAFAATVNLGQSYHVFLTPLGDCALYVAEKAARSFRVEALGEAGCNVDFDYRIIARRAGYESLRLEPAAPATEEE